MTEVTKVSPSESDRLEMQGAQLFIGMNRWANTRQEEAIAQTLRKAKEYNYFPNETAECTLFGRVQTWTNSAWNALIENIYSLCAFKEKQQN